MAAKKAPAKKARKSKGFAVTVQKKDYKGEPSKGGWNISLDGIWLGHVVKAGQSIRLNEGKIAPSVLQAIARHLIT